MPACNHAAFVEAALASIVAQTYPQIELIVIDDGSKDDTALVIERFVAGIRRDMRVEFHRQENRGLGPTLARALNMAKGDYVQFLASDDALFPDMTARVVASFTDARDDVAAIACDGYVFDGVSGPHRTFSSVHPKPFLGNQHRELMAGNWLPAMGLVYRRDRLVEVGGVDPELAYEDWGMLLALTRRYRVAQIPEKLFLYRQHGQNSSANTGRMRDALQVLGKRYPPMAQARFLRNAIANRDFKAVFGAMSFSSLDLGLRFALRQMQRAVWQYLHQDRKQGAVERPVRVKFGANCRIDPSVRFQSGPGLLRVGDGCQIGPGSVLIAGTGLEIGSGSLIEAGAHIGGDGAATHIGRGCLIAEGTRIDSGVTLGDRCATMPGCRISENQPSETWIVPATLRDIGSTSP